MRSVEARVAEIRRRSEAILEARKKRKKHILAACVPLVVCLSLCAGAVLPGVLPEADKDTNTSADGGCGKKESVPENMGVAAGTVEVSGAGSDHRVTDPEQVGYIAALLNQLFAEQEIGGVGNDDLQTGSSTSLTDRDEAAKGDRYHIILIGENGIGTVYWLDGSVITEGNSLREQTLSQEALETLKKALGI